METMHCMLDIIFLNPGIYVLYCSFKGHLLTSNCFSTYIVSFNHNLGTGCMVTVDLPI